MVRAESLDGFTCPKTKQEVQASRQIQVETLPPILILHLKRFVYDHKTGGIQKLMKKIDYKIELLIGKGKLPLALEWIFFAQILTIVLHM